MAAEIDQLRLSPVRCALNWSPRTGGNVVGSRLDRRAAWLIGLLRMMTD